jgi:DNA-binding HxlR family transcriptional regulator
MKGYGQFCPVAKAAEIFCERWTALILRDLAAGSSRFGELRRGVPLMSPTLLSRRLKQLEAEGVIERRTVRGRRGATYHLTPAGTEFAPLVEALGVWGQRWSRRQLSEGEIDLGLLIWNLERSVNPEAFGADRTVVGLEFKDQPAGKRSWWFINRPDGCELCLEDPGFGVDLYLTCSLPDMIYIVRGDLSLAHALDKGRLEVIGSQRMRRRLAAWLNLSTLARIPSQRSKCRDTAA